MRFLLALHDVWPGNFPQAADYLARLRSLGARRIALLVVPAYHGDAPMHGSAEFLAWLREESGRGTELFLHGYHHRIAEHIAGGSAVGDAFRARRNAWGRFINRFVANEAEFAGLPRAAQAGILSAGMAVWRHTGLPLAGFVAPTWHGAPAASRLRSEGIPLWETRFRLHHPSTSRSRFVPPLAWGRAPDSSEPRLLGGEPWLAALLRAPLVKVALHPGDLESRGTESQLSRVFAAGENLAYAEVFGKDSRG
jgi:predicted deacetylase